MALSLSPERGASILPEPILTVVASAEFQSGAVGGSSGKGRFALFSSICFALSVLRSMTDC